MFQVPSIHHNWMKSNCLEVLRKLHNLRENSTQVAFSIRHAEYNPRKHTSITVRFSELALKFSNVDSEMGHQFTSSMLEHVWLILYFVLVANHPVLGLNEQ